MEKDEPTKGIELKKPGRRRHRLTDIQPSKRKKGGPMYVARHGSGKDRHEPTFHKMEDGLAYLDSIKEGRTKANPDQDLANFAELHLELISKDMSKGSVQAFARRTFVIGEILPSITVKMIDVETVLYFRRRAKRYAPTTGEMSYYMLVRILDLAVECSIIERNPCDALPRPKVPENMSALLPITEIEMPIPSEAVYAKLIHYHAPGPGRTLVLLALLTGLRMGEILGLKWKNVQRPIKGLWMLNIQTTKKYRDENDRVKTHSSNRLIPVPDDLKAHLETFAPPVGEQEDVYVCLQPGPKQKPFIYETARRRMKEFQVAAGIGIMTSHRNATQVVRRFEGVCSAHQLRHACAAFWIFAGIVDTTIAQWLGHKDEVFTMDVYGYVFACHDNGRETWPTVIPTIRGGLHA